MGTQRCRRRAHHTSMPPSGRTDGWTDGRWVIRARRPARWLASAGFGSATSRGEADESCSALSRSEHATLLEKDSALLSTGVRPAKGGLEDA